MNINPLESKWAYLGLVENFDYKTVNQLEQEECVINKGGIILAHSNRLDYLIKKYNLDEEVIETFYDFYENCFECDYSEYVKDQLEGWEKIDEETLFTLLYTKFDNMTNTELLEANFQDEIVKEAKSLLNPAS